MSIEELITILEKNKYQLERKIDDFGDTYIEDIDDYETTSGLIYKLDEKEVVIEYHDRSLKILSIVFGNTIFTSYVTDEINGIECRDFSEYDGYIYISEEKINKVTILKCINIHKDPIKSKIKILELETNILKYIQNYLSPLFEEANLDYVYIVNEYPYTENKVDDISLYYYKEDESECFGKSYGLFIYINIITENVWIHLYGQDPKNYKELDLNLDFLGDKNEYIIQTIEDAMIDTKLL